MLRKLPCHLLACWNLACLLTLLRVEQLAADLHPCKWTQLGLWCLGIAIARIKSFRWEKVLGHSF